MGKKLKQANSENVEEQLTIDNISVGMSIPDSTRDSKD